MRESMRDIMHNVPHDPAPKPRLLQNNTVEYYRDGKRIIRLHSTDILEFDGNKCRIFTGGWQTVTTKDRINSYAPVRISQCRGVWSVHSGSYANDTLQTVPFYDGITIVNGKLPKAKPQITKQQTKLAESIRKFVARIDKLAELPKPDSGDCWYCLMFDNVAAHIPPGNPAGAKSANPDHLREHIRQGYLHGSLIVNAVRWAGYQDGMLSLIYTRFDSYAKTTVKRCLRRYLRAQLGLPV